MYSYKHIINIILTFIASYHKNSQKFYLVLISDRRWLDCDWVPYQLYRDFDWTFWLRALKICTNNLYTQGNMCTILTRWIEVLLWAHYTNKNYTTFLAAKTSLQSEVVVWRAQISGDVCLPPLILWGRGAGKIH